MKKRTVYLLCVIILSAGYVLSQQTQMFPNPTLEGKRLDVCLVWGAQCGQAAADAWCKLQGFDSASAFEIAKGIGAQTPTIVLVDKKVCDQPGCDGFQSITCTRAAGSGTQPPNGSVLRIPPGLRNRFPSLPSSSTTSTTTGTTKHDRSDPEEFLVITPKQTTATLGRFGIAAPYGQLEEKRDVPLKTTASVIQTEAADFDGDGQTELALLEAPDPLKPGDADIQILKLTAEMTFTPIASSGTAWVGPPILLSGRFLEDGKYQALVYAFGEAAAILQSNGELDQIQNWKPQGAAFTIDANGDGRDDLLEYLEPDGILNLITFGSAQKSNGEDILPATVRAIFKFGPGMRFAVGDFTGDGRMDLLAHHGATSIALIAQFNANCDISTTNVVSPEWPATYTWTRGYDYDGDGHDDLLIADPGKMVALARFTADGGLREFKVLGEATSTQNLRFPGYFMGNGRASFLSHVRQQHRLSHIWLAVNGDQVMVLPTPITLLDNVPDGALVVVGNFVKGR
jgi:hypothetical protein